VRIDSSVRHDFTFTPAISLYVTCHSEEEVDRLCERLAEGGQVLMPLNAYPFSEKFAWVSDRYGVSWQLTLDRQ
jgi:predicted 3-demethylubiquinone-9 3-methyltransferase (glyoxalase superfamily)